MVESDDAIMPPSAAETGHQASPEVGKHPEIDVLRPLPDQLGFIETPDLTAARQVISEWLTVNVGEVQQAIADPNDTPQLFAMREQWNVYCDLCERKVDQWELVGSGRERAVLGMLIDQALVWYDAGFDEQFWDRAGAIVYAAAKYESELPAIMALKDSEHYQPFDPDDY